jgi:hypothetical protein
MKNQDLLISPYKGKLETKTTIELAYAYNDDKQAGFIYFCKTHRIFVFSLHPMYAKHILGMVKPYHKVRFRNLQDLAFFIQNVIQVTTLKSCSI